MVHRRLCKYPKGGKSDSKFWRIQCLRSALNAQCSMINAQCYTKVKSGPPGHHEVTVVTANGTTLVYNIYEQG